MVQFLPLPCFVEVAVHWAIFVFHLFQGCLTRKVTECYASGVLLYTEMFLHEIIIFAGIITAIESGDGHLIIDSRKILMWKIWTLQAFWQEASSIFSLGLTNQLSFVRCWLPALFRKFITIWEWSTSSEVAEHHLQCNAGSRTEIKNLLEKITFWPCLTGIKILSHYYRFYQIHFSNVSIISFIAQPRMTTWHSRDVRGLFVLTMVYFPLHIPVDIYIWAVPSHAWSVCYVNGTLAVYSVTCQLKLPVGSQFPVTERETADVTGFDRGLIQGFSWQAQDCTQDWYSMWSRLISDTSTYCSIHTV